MIMMKFVQSLVVLVVFLFSLLHVGVQARPTGAGACNLETSSVGHGQDPGTLADAGVTVTIDGTSLTAGTTTALTVGTAVEVTVSATAAWRGILVRIAGATVTPPTTGGMFQVSDLCPAGVRT